MRTFGQLDAERLLLAKLTGDCSGSHEHNVDAESSDFHAQGLRGRMQGGLARRV